ncbi:MAG: thioredoxin domain-containing protein [Cellulophaga sp.]
MKTVHPIFCSFLFFLLTINTYGQSINTKVTDKKGNEKLLGIVNRNGLTKDSFNKWFTPNYEAYLVNQGIVDLFKEVLKKEYRITVFFGSWCGDSKRELPKFYKILDAAGFPEERLTVVGVDNSTEAYKKSPTGEEKGLNIHRVPTFIFYKDGKEVNRIIEFPKETLERDMLTIISGKRYSGNYRVTTYLEGLVQTKGLDSLHTMEKELLPVIGESVAGSRELNTYGYMKLRANDIDLAVYLFDINTKLFPYNKNTFDSLGEAYLKAENHVESLKNYHKVLAIDPKNTNAKSMIAMIKAEM